MTPRRPHATIARAAGICALLLAPVVFLAFRWYGELMAGWPAPGPEPVEPPPPASSFISDDLIILGVALAIAAIGVGLIAWSMKRPPALARP